MDPLHEQAADRAISRYIASHPNVTSAEEVAADPEFHRLLNEEYSALSSGSTTGPRCDTATTECPLHRACTLQISASHTQIRSGEQTTITATGANGPVNWTINGNSTPSATTGNVITITGATISETVSVQAVDGLGCLAAMSITVCNLTVTTQTIATSPANRARTRIGVGEEIELTASVACTWTMSGGNGTLIPATGSVTTVRYTAGDQAGPVTITANHAPCSQPTNLTVVAPSHWTMSRRTDRNLRHRFGRPSCGWQGYFYAHPNDVNFYRIETREVDSQAVCSGSFSSQNGEYHGQYPLPDRVSPWFAMNSHTEANGSTDGSTDDIYSGSFPNSITGSAPPFITGTKYFTITMQWHIVGSANVHDFSAVRQESIIFEDGRCKTAKGGHYETTNYNDPESNYV